MWSLFDLTAPEEVRVADEVSESNVCSEWW